MATVFDSATRRALNDRVARLRPDMVGRWGRFTCPQMLAHLNDAMRMGLGDLPTRPMKQPLRYPGIKQFDHLRRAMAEGRRDGAGVAHARRHSPVGSRAR